MRAFFILLSTIIITACNNNQVTSNRASGTDSATVVKTDTLSRMRQNINPEPVASFSKPIANSLNNWHFSVKVYETEERFHYLMKLEYMELRKTDTLKIPNIGIEPKIEIHKAKDEYSCIVGFFDKNNNFKEYKLVSAKDDKLKVTVLHHYGVATYKQP
jgi:hypothetical protein